MDFESENQSRILDRLVAIERRQEMVAGEVYQLRQELSKGKVRVQVGGVSIGFGQMVSLLVTVALAAIPALLVLFFVGFFVTSVLAGLVASF